MTISVVQLMLFRRDILSLLHFRHPNYELVKLHDVHVITTQRAQHTYF